MPNISSITKSHNKKILSKDESKLSKSTCKFRDKSFCPLSGNWLQQNVIYFSKVIPRNQFTNKNHPLYIRLTENLFNDRLYKLKNSFKCDKKNKNEMQQNGLVLYVTRRAKTLMYHFNGVYQIKLNHIHQVQRILCVV